MKGMIEDISNQLSSGQRIIAAEPTLSKETWTKAATMHVNEFKCFKAKSNDSDKQTYVLPSSKCESENANEKYYKYLVKRNWESLDEFINFGFQQFWIVQVSMTDWKVSSSCSCPIFFKHHMCKHIVAIAVKQNITQFPAMANPIPLASRRTPGRIANAKRALEHQQ